MAIASNTIATAETVERQPGAYNKRGKLVSLVWAIIPIGTKPMGVLVRRHMTTVQ